MMKTLTDTIIVGAGLSGLVAAKTLQNQNHTVTVLEQAPTVGGRLATHMLHGGLADAGSQFFSSRTPLFQQQVREWLDSGLVYVWGYDWSDGSIKRSTAEGRARYVTQGGMSQLAETLAATLDDVRTGFTVKDIRWTGDHWIVTDSNHREITSRALILTPPVPQSLALLDNVPLSQTDRDELGRIHYNPCLCGLFAVDGELNLPAPGALQDFTKTVYWIADNQAKGISPQVHIITMHVDKIYSQQHFEAADANTLAFLRAELEQYLTAGAVITGEALKKWRYGIPWTTHPHDILKATYFPLIFAGDAFGGRGRMEGAYLSGLVAGQEAALLVMQTAS